MIKFIRSFFKKQIIIKERLWITHRAQEFIERILTPEMNVFEWGSGGSTIYLSRRVKSVVSVEHDKKWFSALMKYKNDQGIRNAGIWLLEPVRMDRPECESKSPDFSGYDFGDYCRFITNFPDQSFDLIVVDGRARNSCVLLAKDKVKIGGYILVDDTDRKYYEESLKTLTNFERIDFRGMGDDLDFEWQTSIFKRIK